MNTLAFNAIVHHIYLLPSPDIFEDFIAQFLSFQVTE